MNSVPRNKTVGAGQTLHQFTLDGMAFQLRGNSTEIAVSGVILGFPEPSAFGMMLCGAVGLAGFRRGRGNSVEIRLVAL